MNHVIRVETAGTSEHGAISQSDSTIDETKSWFSRRFNLLFLIGISVFVITMLISVFVIILITRLNEANHRVQNSISNAQLEINQFAQRIQGPLSQLGPTLAKLNSFNFLQTPGLPTEPRNSDTPPIIPVIGSEKPPTNVHRSPDLRYNWKGCHNHGICKRKELTDAPLVILSLDGFARQYLERKIVKTLDYIAECGAKAERVFPSYPSKTFPNHYAIVTGLYPESHGITDNNVFDMNLSPDLESMKSTKKQFFGGDPIWSVYKRNTKKRANCLFWVGCQYNASGIVPDVSPPYNSSVKFRERIDMIIDWLNLPDDKRPGLITAYMDQPDAAGHYQNDVDGKLAELDGDLDYFLSRLNEEKILECINLVILSDHGMNVLNQTYYYDDFVNMDGLVGAEGVVGRIYINESDISPSDLSDKFKCKMGATKSYTRSTIPTRKHYSSNPRVGDVILEGPAGTTFRTSRDHEYQFKADHGYDYLNPNMQTIFFARGPAFKKNVTVPAFQNVQYMNLWASLLGIEDGFVPNNGTVGYFDKILANEPIRKNPVNQIRECLLHTSDSLNICSGHAEQSQKVSREHLELRLKSCNSTTFPIFSNTHCFKAFCNNSVIENENGIGKGIVEVLSKNSFPTKINFTYSYSKYDDNCPIMQNNMTSIAVKTDEELSSMSDTLVYLPNNFILRVLDPLQEKTIEYLNRFGRLYVITGTAVDVNYDGIADNNPNSPTHLYRIIVRCTGRWNSTSPPVCEEANQMKTLAFIFPIVEKSTIDCMDTKSIFNDYMSTIFDVEQLTGFKFLISSFSHHDNVLLRRMITTKLW